jgi:phosphoglycolate phosphatase-like HAD superfamily hydrolase
MIDPRHIAFDIDGVIADTMHLFLDIGKELYGITHLRYADFTDYHLDNCLDIEPEMIGRIVGHIIEGDYPCRLNPIDGAADVLDRLCAFGPLRLVTARPKPGPIAAWMADLLPRQDRIQITATGGFEAKTDILLEQKVTHFVEDRLETCYLIQEHGITPVLYVQPWNRQPHPFIEVHGWDQLEVLIDFES